MNNMTALFVLAVMTPVILFTVFMWYKAIYPFRVMRRESGEGRRTIFEVDTSDYGYEYYENMLLKWLDGIGYSQYSKKRKGRSIKYLNKGGVYRFGLNYYKKDNKLIIEAWIIVFKREYPLVTVFYAPKNKPEQYRAVDQQHKDTYIELLKSLMNMPEEIQDTNSVTFVSEICVGDVKGKQKKEKASNTKLVVGIISVSMVIALFIEQPFDFNKPKGSKEDLQEGLQLIESLYPDFQLDKKYFSVLGSGEPNNEYYVGYFYYGTMNTPVEENGDVMFFIRKYSDGSGWYGYIYDCNSNSLRWDLYYRQNEK